MAEKYPYTKEDVLGVDHLSEKQKQDIADDWNKSHLEAEAVRYSECRQAEYPSIGDQMDYIFHNGVSKWKTDIIEPVKTKWPKDNSGPVEEEESPEEEEESPE